MSQYEIDAYEVKARERNIPLGGRTIYLDLCGLPLQQSTVDIITQEANHDPSQPVNIIIRRLSATGGVPRLIVDHGEIYEAVKLLLVERENRPK